MNLKEVCKEIARRHRNISAYRVESVLQSFLDVVEDELSKGGSIYFRRLGRIEIRCRRWAYKRKRKHWFDEKVRGVTIVPHIKVSAHLKNLFKKGE